MKRLCPPENTLRPLGISLHPNRVARPAGWQSLVYYLIRLNVLMKYVVAFTLPSFLWSLNHE